MITVHLEVKLDPLRFLQSELGDIHGPSRTIGQALATELELILDGGGVQGRVRVVREEGGLPPVRISIPYDVIICTEAPECYGPPLVEAMGGRAPQGIEGGVDLGGRTVLFPTSQAACLLLGVHRGERLVIPTGDLRGWTLLVTQVGLTIGEDRRKGRPVDDKKKEEA